MNEEEIKSRLIDYLLNRSNDKEIVLCSELPFADRNRRADLVVLQKDKIVAFEIKSQKDSLEKLESQLEDYQKSFDLVYLVLAPKHICSARNIANRKVGIYTATEFGIQKLRKATPQKRLDKALLLSLLTKQQLLTFATLNDLRSATLHSKHEIIAAIKTKLPLKNIRAFVIENLLMKYHPRYRHFISERGMVTHPEDLYLLTKEQAGQVPE